MRERTIVGTDVKVTELAFGGASLGNLYKKTTDEDATSAVEAAWDCGIRYFDTAPHYGLGLSERRLGRALSQYPREEFVVSTKVGRIIVPHESPTEWDDQNFRVPGTLRREWDFSRDGILRSVQASLERLDTDYIDIAFLHDPDVFGVDGAAIEGAATLLELRDEGVIRAVGIGSNDAAEIADLFDATDIDTAMVAGRYTLLEQRGADAIFEAAGDRSIIAVGVFNSGLLSTPHPTPGARYNYETASQETLEDALELAAIADRNGITLPHAAIQFPLLNPRVASVAIGMRTAAQVHANTELYSTQVATQVWDDYRSNGRLS
jgi:D-threo-aldose 1-dehydrogenase